MKNEGDINFGSSLTGDGKVNLYEILFYPPYLTAELTFGAK